MSTPLLPRTPQPTKEQARALIAARVPALARQYRVPARRLESALKRTVTRPSIWPPDRPTGLKFEDLRFNPSPLEALRVAGRRRAAEALGLFHDDDSLLMLRRRLATLRYLLQRDVPLHDRGELALRLAGLRRFLLREADHLIETGYASTEFEASPWLNFWLTTLYPTAEPEVQIPPPPRDGPPTDHAVGSCRCRWCAAAVVPIQSLASPGNPRGVATPSDKVHRERWQMFSLRVDVVEAMKDAAESGDGSGLFDRCVRAVTSRLDPDDLAFYLDLDNDSYFGSDLGGATAAEMPGPPGAGLTMTLLAAAMVHGELVAGAFDHASQELRAVVDDPAAYRASPGGAYTLYLDALRDGTRRRLDAMLIEFPMLHARTTAFAEAFVAQLVRDLGPGREAGRVRGTAPPLRQRSLGDGGSRGHRAAAPDRQRRGYEGRRRHRDAGRRHGRSRQSGRRSRDAVGRS